MLFFVFGEYVCEVDFVKFKYYKYEFFFWVNFCIDELNDVVFFL